MRIKHPTFASCEVAVDRFAVAETQLELVDHPQRALLVGGEELGGHLLSGCVHQAQHTHVLGQLFKKESIEWWGWNIREVNKRR